MGIRGREYRVIFISIMIFWGIKELCRNFALIWSVLRLLLRGATQPREDSSKVPDAGTRQSEEPMHCLSLQFSRDNYISCMLSISEGTKMNYIPWNEKSLIFLLLEFIRQGRRQQEAVGVCVNT